MFKIRRTLIVGLGERGARAAGAVHRELNARTGGLPVVRCLALVSDEAAIPSGVTGLALASPSSMKAPDPAEGTVASLPNGTAASPPDLGHEGKLSYAAASSWEAWEDLSAILTGAVGRLTVFLSAGLLEAHRLAHDRYCARRGWPVAPGPGAATYVVADLGDPLAAAGFVTTARLLRQVTERRAPNGIAICGVALLPDLTGSPEETPSLATAHLALQTLEQAAALPPAFAWSEGDDGDGGEGDPNLFPLFNDDCYLLTVANEDGLTANGEEVMEEMVAAWLVELLLTPLGLALDHRTPLGGGADFGSFGLANWRFPAAELAAYLAARLQTEMVGSLLAPSAGTERPVVAAFQHHDCSPPSLWPDSLRFPVTPHLFTPPDLQRLGRLKREVDAAVQAAAQDLVSAAQNRDAALQEAVADGLTALQAETDALVDALGEGLDAAAVFLESLTRTWQQETAQAAGRAAEARRRITRLNDPLTEAGAKLENVLAHFPPWRLTAWLRLLARPWCILRLLLAYQEIGQRVAAYLAVQQARWLLEAEALEADWQAAFYRYLAEAAEERLRLVRRFRRGIAELGDRLSKAPALSQIEVDRLLQANALPRNLAGHYYRRAAGDAGQALAALLAVYGPLSRWLAEDLPLAEVEQLTAEYAAERFSFLQQVRLDELLARTYTGRELKACLRELLAAARPFWSGDEASLTPGEGTGAALAQFVGLPQPESSPLAGLLAETWPEVGLYAGGDPHRITAVQVRRGLPLRALRIRADYQAAWKSMHQRHEFADAGENE